MTKNNFVQGVLQIPGIDSYLLTRNDGQVIAHNMASPQAASSLSMASGLGAVAIKSHFGFSNCRHISFAQKDQQHLFVFKFGKYFLCIRQAANASQGELISAVYRYLNDIVPPAGRLH